MPGARKIVALIFLIGVLLLDRDIGCCFGASRVLPSTIRASIPTRGEFSNMLLYWNKIGAGEGDRTLDPDLGKVVLYR